METESKTTLLSVSYIWKLIELNGNKRNVFWFRFWFQGIESTVLVPFLVPFFLLKRVQEKA